MSRFYDWVTRGLRSAQPAAAAANKGMLYFVTDEGGKLERSSGSAWETMAGSNSGIGFDMLYTDESQASGSGVSGWLDLATVGPVVTIVTTLTVAFIEMRAKIRRPGGGGGFTGFIALAVSGATTINPANPNPVFPSNGGDDAIAGSGSAEQTISGGYFLTGLTPGTNVFTMKYHNDGGGTWNFRERFMRVHAK